MRVATYPVAERAGLVWVYVGDLPAPPVEEDIPEELLRPNLIVEGRYQLRPGNWRYAAENGIDEGHARYLHRNAVWTLLRRLPAWTKGVRLEPSDDGKWMWRVRGEAIFEDTSRASAAGRRANAAATAARQSIYHQLGIRLPATLDSWSGQGYTDFQMWVPVDADTPPGRPLAVTQATGPACGAVPAVVHGSGPFAGSSTASSTARTSGWSAQMDTPPERLYRRDTLITAWRKYVEEHARGAGAAPTHRTNGATTHAALPIASPAPTSPAWRTPIALPLAGQRGARDAVGLT